MSADSNLLFIGVASEKLSAAEMAQLRCPVVAGVVLFKRNFTSAHQLAELCAQIKSVSSDLVICADQEGGRVQRFVDEHMSPLPALGRLGAMWDSDPDQALGAATCHAWLMASELRGVGVDFSFAPVADLNNGSNVIGDRAFHADPDVVSRLALAYLQGLREAGVPAVAKHFPGHGSVLPDTHHHQAEDPRSLAEIEQQDLVPFSAMIEARVDGVMAGHVVYPCLSPRPAGFSQSWVTQFLRQKMGFRGIVFSDDLGMAGAGLQSATGAAAATVQRRVAAAAASGCQVGLVCEPEQATQVLECFDARMARSQEQLETQAKLAHFRAAQVMSVPLIELQRSSKWQRARTCVDELNAATN